MGLFSFLNRKNESGNAAISMLPVINPVEQADEEVSSVMTTTEPESSENKPLTVSYATGWPIDIIYGYLHKNYEEKGFGDSMIKSDLTFRDMNMNIIKNKILMVFRELVARTEALEDLSVLEGYLDRLHRLVRMVSHPCRQHQRVLPSVV